MAQKDAPHTASGIRRWLEEEVSRPMEDFEDPKQEWRRLFSELLGTFFLVLVAAFGYRFPGRSPFSRAYRSAQGG